MEDDFKCSTSTHIKSGNPIRKGIVFESSRLNPADREDFEATGGELHFTSSTKGKKQYQ